jgi:hypothetical protein
VLPQPFQPTTLSRKLIDLLVCGPEVVLHRAEFLSPGGELRREVSLLLITDQPVVAAGVERTPSLHVEGLSLVD